MSARLLILVSISVVIAFQLAQTAACGADTFARPRDILRSVLLKVARSQNQSGNVAVYEKQLREASSQGNCNAQAASALEGLGNAYKTMGRYDESLSVFSRCLQMRQKLFGDESVAVAATLVQIADVYLARQDFPRGESCLRKALLIMEKELPSDDRFLSLPLHKLAVVLSNEKRHADALPLAKRSLEIREKHVGSMSPILVEDLITLCDLESCLYNWRDGLNYLQRAERLVSEQEMPSLKTLLSIEQLKAHFLKGLGRYKEAIAAAIKCQQLSGEMNPAQKVVCDECLLCEALCYVYLQDTARLKAVDAKVRPIAEGLLTSTNRWQDYCLYAGEASKVFRLNKDYATAEAWSKRAVAAAEKLNNVSQLQASRKHLLMALWYQLKLDEALSVARKDADLCERYRGPFDVDYITSLNNLAYTYFQMKKFDEANKTLVKAIHLLDQHPQENAALRRVCLSTQAQIQQAINNKAESK